MKKFFDQYLDGSLPAEAIHDAIEEWHASNSKESLHEYLGLSWLEYSEWVKDNNCLLVIQRSRELTEALKGTGFYKSDR